MKLIINGEERAFEGVSNVAELIDKLGIKGDRVAVELNREIVPRAQWAEAALKDGDKLEIVHFVGGGTTRRAEHGINNSTKRIPDLELPPKKFYICDAKSFGNIPGLIRPESKNFGLFIAADVSDTSVGEIATAARRLVERGLAYLCAWGPDCERVHDIFDEAVFPFDEGKEDVIMTTWHSQSLEEAIFFFIYSAVPTTQYLDTCTDWIAVSINSPAWAATIRERILAEVRQTG